MTQPLAGGFTTDGRSDVAHTEFKLKDLPPDDGRGEWKGPGDRLPTVTIGAIAHEVVFEGVTVEFGPDAVVRNCVFRRCLLKGHPQYAYYCETLDCTGDTLWDESQVVIAVDVSGPVGG